MDTMAAFVLGAANRGKEQKVFDWDKAVDILKERGIKDASAGLHLDLEYTSGDILVDGEPVKDYCYLASTWATPVLVTGWGEEIPCWIMASRTEYNHSTIWPKSAFEKMFPDRSYDKWLESLKKEEEDI